LIPPELSGIPFLFHKKKQPFDFFSTAKEVSHMLNQDGNGLNQLVLQSILNGILSCVT